MEFVGKTVKKELKGVGVFSGIVQSYDASSGFFAICYEDGDTEELEFSDVVSILEGKEEEADPVDCEPREVGRKPRKRRRVESRNRRNGGGDGGGRGGEESGNSNSYFHADVGETLGREVGLEADRDFGLVRNVDLNDGGLVGGSGESEGVNGNCVNVNNIDLNENLERGNVDRFKEVLDLNSGFNLNLNEGFDLNEGDNLIVNCRAELMERGCIDLNLDVNGDVDENLDEVGLGGNVVEAQKRECKFDLNLVVDEETKDDVGGDCVGHSEENASLGMVKEETEMMVKPSRLGLGIQDGGGTPEEVHDGGDSRIGMVKGFREGETVSAEDGRVCEAVELLDAEGIKKDGPVSTDGKHDDMGSVFKEDSVSLKRGRRRGRKPGDSLNSNLENFTTVIDVNGDAIGDMRSERKEETGNRRRGRRRGKKPAENLIYVPAPEMPVLMDAQGYKEDCTVIINVNQDTVGDMRSAYTEESSSQKRGRRRGRKPADNLDSAPVPEVTVLIDPNSVKDDCSMVIDVNQDDMESAHREVRGSYRKRRKLMDHANSMLETTVLRRSTRRGSARINGLMSTMSIVVNDLSEHPPVSALTEENPMTESLEEPAALPLKVQLPPSSQRLDLDGIPVLDLFSIYSFLRSFSAILFLSPFELEDFAAALKCNSPSSLLDCIHVSILQTLRKHLEHLSNEGSESASDCLRSLDWGLLDLMTWPVFMVEYLLIHGSGLNPRIDLNHLKLFKNEYYKQPVSTKVEILQFLCDNVTETEAIRSELTRRSSGVESDLDFDRMVNFGAHKKKRAAVDVSGGSCLVEEAADETTDGNSDECCLCKMDGNLICCDGCPAAYHSKCVGVVNDSLPEGDWYCPECSMDRHKPWLKPRKSLRGADLLGIDPYGRLYFSSCGYLLVSDSCDSECSFNYYHKDDIGAVVKVLKSSQIYYSSIMHAIYNHWGISVGSYGATSNLVSENLTMCPDMCISPSALAYSEAYVVKNETVGHNKPQEKFGTKFPNGPNVENLKSVNPSCITSERNYNCHNGGADGSNISAELLNRYEMAGGNLFPSNSVEVNTTNNPEPATTSHTASAVNMTDRELQLGTSYMNYYSFGYTASLVVEELMRKSSDKINEDSLKSDEEIVSAQMKVISKKYTKFRWPNIPNLNDDVQKEKCGWCFSCRVPTDDTECLFYFGSSPAKEGNLSEVRGLQSQRKRQSHLWDIIFHIFLAEDRLQGLLLGPWLNPHFTRVWHKNIVKEPGVVFLRRLLLMLESNLHHRALSPEWTKHVDSAVTLGSASHIVTASLRASSKSGAGRKRTRYPEMETNSCSNAESGLCMFWWRGGRLSRKLFSWKVLPRSLASKAAREAGCKKIPGILYPENSDLAKRSKCIAWRAAVESSNTVEQLALQVRELDLNVRWDEIENTRPLSMLDKEFRKSFRFFKKAIIRRKSTEGGCSKYLLDFGKRKLIPEVVLKNGSVVEESSSERKKYWLSESDVPLHLLKSFEERKIARKTDKMSSLKPSETSVTGKRLSKSKGFSYLFARAEKLEYHQCGHCKKDVLIREAVSCQYCKGFFHRRHVRKSVGSFTADRMYSCHRCQNGIYVNIDRKKVKVATKGGKNKKSVQVSQQKSKKLSLVRKSARLKNNQKAPTVAWSLRSQKNRKVTTVVPLRRSPRKTKYNSTLYKKVGGRKKGKKVKSRKAASTKSKQINSLQKKRNQAYHSYWLNGLLLSRKPDDERVMHFRQKRLLVPLERVIDDQQPRCHLCCEADYTETLNYISCEMCGEWFHGDAFGLNAENIGKLIGFRCHVCRKSAIPICSHAPSIRGHGHKKTEAQNVEVESSEGVSDSVQHHSEMDQLQQSCSDEDHRCSLPVDDVVLRDKQFGEALDSNHSLVLKAAFEGQNGNSLSIGEENTDAMQISSTETDTKFTDVSH